jgi:hypothetical protein
MESGQPAPCSCSTQPAVLTPSLRQRVQRRAAKSTTSVTAMGHRRFRTFTDLPDATVRVTCRVTHETAWGRSRKGLTTDERAEVGAVAASARRGGIPHRGASDHYQEL